jgi:uncharacterized membrane protein (UPF0127 family)
MSVLKLTKTGIMIDATKPLSSASKEKLLSSLHVKKAQANPVDQLIMEEPALRAARGLGLTNIQFNTNKIPPTGAFTNALAQTRASVVQNHPIKGRILRGPLAEAEQFGSNVYKRLTPAEQRRVDVPAYQSYNAVRGKNVDMLDAARGTYSQFNRYGVANQNVLNTLPNRNPSATAGAIRKNLSPPTVARSQQGFVKTQSSNDIPFNIVNKTGVKKASVVLEIADSEPARRAGLSKRAELPEGSGMLFTQSGLFWMKDMNFPIDIVFLDKVGTILERKHMPLDGGRKVYSGPFNTKVAVELPDKWFEANKLQIGDRFIVADEEQT